MKKNKKTVISKKTKKISEFFACDQPESLSLAENSALAMLNVR